MRLTADRHTLAICHLIYGVLVGIGGCGVIWLAANESTSAGKITDIGLWSRALDQTSGLTVLIAIFVLPPILSAYGLLRERPWAIGAMWATMIVSFLVFPIGTALSALTGWFLLAPPDVKVTRTKMSSTSDTFR